MAFILYPGPTCGQGTQAASSDLFEFLDEALRSEWPTATGRLANPLRRGLLGHTAQQHLAPALESAFLLPLGARLNQRIGALENAMRRGAAPSSVSFS